MAPAKHSPTVSVIIPAYNAEKYLKRCLDSFASQTLQDFEVIVVNDGSIDASGQILDSYSQADPRFRIIHQQNMGVAAARQKGMDAAQGTFTIHADADDWVESDMLEQLVKCAKINVADMVICDFFVHFPGGETKIWSENPGSLDHWNVLGKTFHDLYGSLCNRLIRKSCYTSAGIRIDENMFACEDQMAVLSLLVQPIRVAYLGAAYYHYDRSQNIASFVNSNPLIKEKLSVLDRIGSTFNIAPVQDYFDKAVMHLAYDSLFFSDDVYRSCEPLFRKHRISLRRAKGFPLHVRLLVSMAQHGIRLPISKIKQIWSSLSRNETN